MSNWLLTCVPQVQAELAELEEVIVDTQPVVKEVATKIDKLLQLCL